MSEELTVEELDYCDALRKTQTLVMQNGVTVPAVMFDRLIYTARRALPDDGPISEEWMNDQVGWRLHPCLQSFLRDFGEVKLVIDVPLDGSNLWQVFVERTAAVGKLRTIVQLNPITTRSQLTKLIEALGGTP